MRKREVERESRTLQHIENHGGVLLVSPAFRKTKAIKSLLEKGLIRELSGLFKDAPQGYATTD